MKVDISKCLKKDSNYLVQIAHQFYKLIKSKRSKRINLKIIYLNLKYFPLNIVYKN